MTDPATAVRDALSEPRFVSEVIAIAAKAGHERSTIERQLERSDSEGSIVLVAHSNPDMHLRGLDLTTVAAVRERTPAGIGQAHADAERRWNEFLRDFLASHRCG